MGSGQGSKFRRTFLPVLSVGLCLTLGLVVAPANFLKVLAAAVCNGDGVCSYEEWDKKSTPTNQPCPDCQGKVYFPLLIEETGAQIVTPGNETAWSKYKIFQFKSAGTEMIGGEIVGTYVDSWASLKTDTAVPSVYSGDADNDGSREIVALTSSGKGQRLALYRSGSTGAPAWQSPYFAKGAGNIGSLRVGDVDGDTLNEVVMDIGDRIWIARIVPNGPAPRFSVIWTSPSFGVFVWSIDIGDADNLGDNEIILAVFSNGAPIVLKYATGSWPAQPVEQLPNPRSVAIDVAKARDVDGLVGNEILAGGNTKNVMLWKFDGSMYRVLAVSQDLGGFTQGIDAGEFDPALEGNEIVTAAASSGDTGSVGYILKYSGLDATFDIISSVPVPFTSESVCAKDLDGDGLCEVGISIYKVGLNIYEFFPGTRTLLKRFSCIYGGSYD